MRKEELKDGMIIIDDMGVKRLICDSGMLYLNLLNYQVYKIDNIYYNDVLTKQHIKIEYEGQVVWEREEYVTLHEAVATGKRFKHRICEKYFYNLYMAFEELRDCVCTRYNETKEINEYILEQMNEKAWEVEKGE